MRMMFGCDCAADCVESWPAEPAILVSGDPEKESDASPTRKTTISAVTIPAARVSDVRAERNLRIPRATYQAMNPAHIAPKIPASGYTESHAKVPAAMPLTIIPKKAAATSTPTHRAVIAPAVCSPDHFRIIIAAAIAPKARAVVR